MFIFKVMIECEISSFVIIIWYSGHDEWRWGFRISWKWMWVVNVHSQIDGGASKSVWPNSETKISTYLILSLIKGKVRPPKLHLQSGHGVWERVCVEVWLS